MNEEEIQQTIVKARCPTPRCGTVTFVEIPLQLEDTLTCNVCGNTTDCKEWLE